MFFRLRLIRLEYKYTVYNQISSFTRCTNYMLSIFVGEIVRRKHSEVEITNNTVTRKYITKTFRYFICFTIIRNCRLSSSNKYNRVEKKEEAVQQFSATLTTSFVVSSVQYFKIQNGKEGILLDVSFSVQFFWIFDFSTYRLLFPHVIKLFAHTIRTDFGKYVLHYDCKQISYTNENRSHYDAYQ